MLLSSLTLALTFYPIRRQKNPNRIRSLVRGFFSFFR
jgi:hypothetical protein